MYDLKVLAALCLAASVAACGGNTPPADLPDTGAGKPDTGTTCKSRCGDECCQGGNDVCYPTNDTCCTPDCAGKQCGDDGCGGECSTCTGGTICNSSYQCVAANLCPVGKCTGDRPVCNPANGACECTSSSCTGGQVCNASKVCVSNLCAGKTCSTETPCNPANGQCECTTNSCTGGTTCDTATKLCKQDLCAQTSCSIQGETCDASDGKCHCNTAAPACASGWTCNPTDRKCYPATDPCAGKTCNADPALPLCDKQTGACVCTSSPDSCGTGKKCQNGACVQDLCPVGKCSGDRPYCNPANGACECTGMSCTGGLTCDAGTKTCVTVNLCAGKTCSAETPCNSANGLCECTTASCAAVGKTCNATTKVCDAGGLCAGKTCSAETPCNPANGLCECTSASCAAVGKTCNTTTKTCIPGGTDPLVAGCTPPAKQYSGLTSAADFCTAKAKVFCDRMARCCLLAPTQYPTCMAYEVKQCNANDLTARLTGNVMGMDVAKARACLDTESARQTCSSSDFCIEGTFLSPKAMVGGTCLGQVPDSSVPDCVGGFCARTYGTCGGVCKAYGTIGSTCDTTLNKCNPATTWCDTAQSLCVANYPAGTACVGNYQCGLGSYCSTTCKPYLPVGSTCSATEKCLLPGVCIIPDGMTTGTCVVPGTVPEGGTCRKGMKDDCVEGMFCLNKTTAGTCTRFRADGVACTQQFECGPASACVAGFCTAKQGVGGACVAAAGVDYGCKFGLYCLNNLCVPLSDLNGTCTDDTDCLRNLGCVGGKCTLLTAGQACTNSAQCVSAGAYCPKNGGVCTAAVMSGGSCTETAECAGGECETNAGQKKCRGACSY